MSTGNKKTTFQAIRHFRALGLPWTCLLLALLFVNMVQAQSTTIVGEIVYIKVLATGVHRVVKLSLSGSQTFDVPQAQNQCYGVSTLGHYIAESTSQPSNIVIYELATGLQVAQYPWNVEWRPCDFYFKSDTVISIGDLSNWSFNLDIFSGNTNRPIIPTPTSYELSTPPNFVANDLLLRSPANPAMLVYNRCTSGTTATDMEGNIGCTSVPEFVVYDLSNQQSIVVLDNPSLSILVPPSGIAPGLTAPPYDNSISWSPSGLYLAFLSQGNINSSTPSVRIYDTVTRVYLDTSASSNYLIDNLSGFSWSPDETNLVFWLDDGYSASARHLVRPVVFNLQNTSFSLAAQIFTMPAMHFIPVLWSPNNQRFIFVDSDKFLRYITASTGSSSVVDTDIQDIIAWNDNSSTHTPSIVWVQRS